MFDKTLQIYKTQTAKRHIRQIIAYTSKRWGAKLAEKYAMDLEKHIKLIAQGVIKTKINIMFSDRFSYYRFRKHYVFFDIRHDKIIVVGLFHAAMNVKEKLQNNVTYH